MKLYEFPVAMQGWSARHGDEEELTEEAMSELAQIEMSLENKVDACCRVLRGYEARAAAFNAEADRLKRNAVIAANNALQLKRYMQAQLESMDVSKVETPLFKVRIQENPPSVQIERPETVPGSFCRTVTEPDKKMLLEWYRRGEPMPEGVTVTRTRSLRIS